MAKPRFQALVLTDCHSSTRVLDQLESLLTKESYKVVLGLGDLTDAHGQPIRYVQALISIFERHSLPFYTIYGNNEPPSVVKLLESAGHLIHYRLVRVGGVAIGGLGGGEDDQLLVSPLKRASLTTNGIVLLTHYPPHKSFDQPGVFKHAPLVHLCGHRHFPSQWQLGQTLVAQVGAASDGHYAVLTLSPARVDFQKFAWDD